MKRYPKYKESGVECIGEIPAHWESKRLGYVSTIFKGGTPKRNVDRYFQGDLPWARPVDITALKGALYIDDTEIHISEEALGNSGARRLPAGTVLLTSRATIGETAITTVPMATNQGFSNFVCHEHLLNIYLLYYLQAIKDLLISLGSGSTYLEVTKGTLVGVRIPLPPLSEQIQIANFLDRKTEQIDKLIGIKDRQIELLQEQRTALINQAVTKGHDPNVEMKPSGVEWIGE
ncbi:restriction endonuclease subunit S, partial [Candidatus Poribacteria bacterium]|nr:restriction endonuclease subunit S [Candidatus Poribacteria bacterium]